MTVENINAAVGRARETLRDKPSLLADLERTGRERSLIYKTLVLTGLRKGELASLSPASPSVTSETASSTFTRLE